MSRPKFLNCVMTPEIISSIRDRQRIYDQNPEAYERREEENKERLIREEEELFEERMAYEEQSRREN